VNTTETSTTVDPAAADYAAGRADWIAGYCDTEVAVASPAYRRGLADQRTEDVDAELLAAVERGELQPSCSPDAEQHG